MSQDWFVYHFFRLHQQLQLQQQQQQSQPQAQSQSQAEAQALAQVQESGEQCWNSLPHSLAAACHISDYNPWQQQQQQAQPMYSWSQVPAKCHEQ